MNFDFDIDYIRVKAERRGDRWLIHPADFKYPTPDRNPLLANHSELWFARVYITRRPRKYSWGIGLMKFKNGEIARATRE